MCIRDSLWEEAGFAAEVSSLKSRGIASLESVRDEPYFDGAPAEGKFCILRSY